MLEKFFIAIKIKYVVILSNIVFINWSLKRYHQKLRIINQQTGTQSERPRLLEKKGVFDKPRAAKIFKS